MIYEWDPTKAAGNVEKHGVSFEQVASVFVDPAALTFWDPHRSEERDREIPIGRSAWQRVLFVAHCRTGGSCPHHQRTAGHPSGATTV